MEGWGHLTYATAFLASHTHTLAQTHALLEPGEPSYGTSGISDGESVSSQPGKVQPVCPPLSALGVGDGTMRSQATYLWKCFHLLSEGTLIQAGGPRALLPAPLCRAA